MHVTERDDAVYVVVMNGLGQRKLAFGVYQFGSERRKMGEFGVAFGREGQLSGYPSLGIYPVRHQTAGFVHQVGPVERRSSGEAIRSGHKGQREQQG